MSIAYGVKKEIDTPQLWVEPEFNKSYHTVQTGARYKSGQTVKGEDRRGYHLSPTSQPHKEPLTCL